MQGEKPVQWFGPSELIRTGWQAFLSTTIGAFADRREMQAGIAPFSENGALPYHDFRSQRDFDFIADTGEGWRPTFAIAELAQRAVLKPSGVGDAQGLPRPKLVVFGGDLVYPTASAQEYERRLRAPYKQAADLHGLATAGPVNPTDPRAFAIPGNHDWYDGLAAFWSLFCRARFDALGRRVGGRRIGGCVTEQQRSYFAARLAHDWWIWGVDAHLSGWLDQPQINYFADLAKEHLGRNAKLILCCAEPSWVYGAVDAESRFANLGYLLDRAIDAGADVRAVLTGDSHHYSHYVGRLRAAESDHGTAACHFVTAGGGGAFTHPTHHLPEKIEIESASRWAARLDVSLACAYPRKDQSYAAAFRNVWFPALNPQFVLLMTAVWLGLQTEGTKTATTVILVAGLIAFADVRSVDRFLQQWRGAPEWVARTAHLLLRSLVGGGHAFLHLLAGGAVVSLAHACWAACLPDFGARLAAGALGGVLSSFGVGLYLLLATTLFHRHQNEAFSALRLERWKNFLRVRVDSEDRATVSALGLDSIPEDDQVRGAEPHLIEPQFQI